MLAKSGRSDAVAPPSEQRRFPACDDDRPTGSASDPSASPTSRLARRPPSHLPPPNHDGRAGADAKPLLPRPESERQLTLRKALATDEQRRSAESLS